MDAAAPRDDLFAEDPTPPSTWWPAAIVERSLDVDASPSELWRMIADPAELATWLGTDVDLVLVRGGRGRLTDDDGTVRHAVVEALDPERRLVLRWWRADEGPAEASVVTMAVSPRRGGARLVVTEQCLGGPTPGATARTSVRASAAAAMSAWQWRLDLLLLRCSTAMAAAGRG
jgi:uncharacterized protein YndB with AHSA1/START domain